MNENQAMTPILTSREMREADRRATEELGIPGAVLMENAARGACDVLAERLGSLRGKHIAIVCGKGNNGGDGLALARLAAIEGAEVTCALVAPPEELSGDAAAQYAILSAFAPDSLVRWSTFARRDRTYDAVVDALLGTGAQGAPRGGFATAVRWINRQSGFTFALDVPTGIDSDTGIAAGEAVRADATATMATLKPGLLLNDGAECAGDVRVVHIGAPRSLYGGARLELLDRDRARQGLPTIERTRHKYNRGKILICAGSRGMTGAGTMSAEAALRFGSGLVVWALPESAASVLPQRVEPEIMTRFLPSDGNGFAEEAFESLRPELDAYDALAIGPGLSKSESAAAFVRSLLRSVTVPVVLDADGLNAFAGNPDALADRSCDLVVTPHHGEFARLFGADKKEIAADPVGSARAGAERIGGVVVLKGAPTVVAAPDGSAWINSAGNPGMATGGTGDVLTGMIVSMIGQSGRTVDGALTAVYLHSLAADIAVSSGSPRSMTATDIIRTLPNAYTAITSN